MKRNEKESAYDYDDWTQQRCLNTEKRLLYTLHSAHAVDAVADPLALCDFKNYIALSPQFHLNGGDYVSDSILFCSYPPRLHRNPFSGLCSRTIMFLHERIPYTSFAVQRKWSILPIFSVRENRFASISCRPHRIIGIDQRHAFSSLNNNNNKTRIANENFPLKCTFYGKTCSRLGQRICRTCFSFWWWFIWMERM